MQYFMSYAVYLYVWRLNFNTYLSLFQNWVKYKCYSWQTVVGTVEATSRNIAPLSSSFMFYETDNFLVVSLLTFILLR